jgi:hypothetical protein
MEIPYVPRTPFGGALLGDEGDANKLFFTYLFSDMDIQFLKDVGLIRSKVTCNIHRAPFTCPPYPTRTSFQSHYDRGLRPVLYRETMLVYLEGCSEKIGGPNKTVEIDESKFGQCQYRRGHPVKGQKVFSGVELESGKTFLVPVPERIADALKAVIDVWIEPGTTVISECWAVYKV